MVRNYKRKQKPVDMERLSQAINMLLNEKVPIRRASRMFGVNHATLKRYFEIVKTADPFGALPSITPSILSQILTKKGRTAFTGQQEEALVEYLKQNTDPHFGLTSRDVKVLAYKFAKGLEIFVPGWEVNGMAGVDWLKGFTTRNPSLNIQKGTAEQQKAAPIERENIAAFLDQLRREEAEKSLSCPICVASFDSTDKLTQHLELHTPEEFECAHCFRRFPDKASLAAHIWHHKKMLNDEKRADDELFSCPTCSEVIRGVYHFHDHQSLHAFEKPFVCLVCMMRFKCPIALAGHKKRIHTWEGRKYPCPGCGFTFKYLGNLKKHQRKHKQEAKNRLKVEIEKQHRYNQKATPIFPVELPEIKTEIEDYLPEGEIEFLAVKIEDDPLGIKEEVE